MKIRLPYKLAFIFCLIVGTILAIGYIYLSNQFKAYIEKDLESMLKKELFLVRDLWQIYLEKEKDTSGADSFADKLAKDLNLRITIIDHEGWVLGDSELTLDEIEQVENHIDRPEIKEAIKNGLGKTRRFSNTIKKNLLYLAVPFKTKNFSGFIRVAMPITEIRLLELDWQKTISVGFLLIFSLGMIFIFLVSFFVSKPIIEISKVAESIARGDFSNKPLTRSKDEIGTLAKVLSYMSERIKQDIDRINKERAKLDAVLSSMFEGIMVVDNQGMILLVNPSLRKQLLLDFSPENKMPIEVVRNQQIQSIVDKIIKDKKSLVTQEISLFTPQEKIFKVNAVPIILNNNLEGAVLVFHDITELRRLERIRQDFVANVSHELRTPISSIKGYLETLLEGAMEEKDNLKEFLGIIYKDTNRLANLIEDLLDLSKIESGKIKFHFEALDIKPIIESALNILEKNIKDKAISVNLEIQKNLPKVLADEKRLLQVFLNLLDNAIKYNVQNGKITIKAYTVNGWVQIEISDTGIGIPEKDLPRIFERFYRVDKARSRELGGTGLGLSIVKHIIQAHKGEVWVKSEVAKGSTFFFSLPQAENTL